MNLRLERPDSLIRIHLRNVSAVQFGPATLVQFGWSKCPRCGKPDTVGMLWINNEPADVDICYECKTELGKLAHDLAVIDALNARGSDAL